MSIAVGFIGDWLELIAKAWVIAFWCSAVWMVMATLLKKLFG